MNKDIRHLNNKSLLQQILQAEHKLTNVKIDAIVKTPLTFDSLAFPADVITYSLTRGYY